MISWGKFSLPVPDLVQSLRGGAVKDLVPVSSHVFPHSCLLRTRAFTPRSLCGIVQLGPFSGISAAAPLRQAEGDIKGIFSTLIQY